MSSESPRQMPAQKPGRSVQVVETPWELIDAIESRWGAITFDLAATAQNCKVRHFPEMRFGPEEDSLTREWTSLLGNLWLNPPFGGIEPWAKKCFVSLGPERRIFFLVPASVGSNWWAKWVHEKAAVKFLGPRVTFVGHTQGYPKDLALCIYSDEKPGYECWRWKK
jgi:phage N-6-adenine-methyltransferase